MLTEKDRIISPVITFASALVVLFIVMCPGELIILKETKAILFPVSQDANLFWLVILLWGLFAAALGIKARSNTPSSRPGPRVPACAGQASRLQIPKNPFKCCLGVTINESTFSLAEFQATFWPPKRFLGKWVCLTDAKLGDICPEVTGYNVSAHTFFACSWYRAKFGFEKKQRLQWTILFIVEVIILLFNFLLFLPCQLCQAKHQ